MAPNLIAARNAQDVPDQDEDVVEVDQKDDDIEALKDDAEYEDE